MFSGLFGGLQAQIPQPPYGCTGFCEASVIASGAPIINRALAVLAGVIGTYGFIEQIKLQRRMVKLAERSADKADDYYDQSKLVYDTIALPSWDRMKALYDRFVEFEPYEDSYVNCAYALREYCPDVVTAANRAIGRVTKYFAAAEANRRRYSCGTPCATAYLPAMRALAQTSAASAALQYEENRKRELDEWYWQRWKDGAAYVSQMGDRAYRALAAGVANVSKSLQGVGEAVGVYQQAAAGQAGAIANAAQFWGNIASGGLGGFGYAVGAGYFNTAQTTGSWTPTVTTTTLSATNYSSYK